jgi:hypothetical protein
MIHWFGTTWESIVYDNSEDLLTVHQSSLVIQLKTSMPFDFNLIALFCSIFYSILFDNLRKRTTQLYPAEQSKAVVLNISLYFVSINYYTLFSISVFTNSGGLELCIWTMVNCISVLITLWVTVIPCDIACIPLVHTVNPDSLAVDPQPSLYTPLYRLYTPCTCCIPR